MEYLNNYDSDTTAVSKSGLDKIDISPLDYWWKYLRPDREPYVADAKTLFDDALRCAVFEPKLFAHKYVKGPTLNKTTSVGKSEWAFLERHASTNGLLILSATEYDTIQKMRDAITKHPTAKILCGAGTIGTPTKFEQSETGAPIKFRPHFVHSGGIIVHLMSTKDASLNNFQKEAGNFRHDKKAIIQMEGLKLDGMAFINIEQDAPYKIGLRFMDDRSLIFGRETVIRNCETYLQCLASGDWYGLEEKVIPASLPEWMLRGKY